MIAQERWAGFSLKKILAAIVLLIAVGIVGIWLTFSSANSFDITSGTEHILQWDVGPAIKTQQGNVAGLTNGRVQAYLGLRYAQPPIGTQRFMPPVASEPWPGTFDATTFPNVAMQSNAGLERFAPEAMSEDCLFLNVFTPSTLNAHRPVMIWIHGGSYMEGSANTYDGSVLVEQGDVVVVVINYRLGMLGFLDLSGLADEFSGSAANGIRDQILALQWVQDNIDDYGGNPNNVTIFGESAGGGSVLSILSAPSAEGLYHKAIVHSAGLIHSPPEDFTQPLAEHLSVKSNQLVDALRELSPTEIIQAQTAVSYSGGGKVDGTVVTRTSDQAILDQGNNGVPIIAGSNRDEGTLFSYLIPSPLYGVVGEAVAASVIADVDGETYVAKLKQAYPNDNRTQRFERIWTDLLRRGVVNSAVRATAAGPGGWLYRFDLPAQRGADIELGASHAVEIPFTFNNFASDAPNTAFFHNRQDPVVRELALNWSNTILQFAKTGDPNGAGLPIWPRYTAEQRQSLILDANPRIETFVDEYDRARWGDTEKSAAELLSNAGLQVK